MKTESNIIDSFIKKDLRYEIVYRVLLWTIISVSTYLIISSRTGFSLMDYFKSNINNSSDIINVVLPPSLLLVIISALFKDMEVRCECYWSQKRLLGVFGAIIRKICSEVLLWGCALSFGIFLITAFTTSKVIAESGITDKAAFLKVCYLLVLFLMIFSFNAIFYIACRKEGGTIFQTIIEEAKYIPIIYTLAALVCIGWVYIGFQ